MNRPSGSTANGIRRIIKRKHLTQAAVAERAGFTPQQINDMLQGRTRIYADHIPALAAALEVEPCEIFREDEWNGILSEKYESLSVLDLDGEKELAAISADCVTTASDNIVVRLKPRNP